MNIRAVMVACAVVIFAGFVAGCGRDAHQPSATATLLPDAEATATNASFLGGAATAFDLFPLVWLGESYDSDGDGDGVGDLVLSSAYYLSGETLIHPRTGAVIIPALRSFTLSYGTCEIPKGRSQCGVPVTIVIEPPDNQGPSPGGPRLRIRGVDAFDTGEGSLFIETADFSVIISAPHDQVGRIANQLFGENAKAAGITKDSDLRPKGSGVRGSSTVVPR